MPLKMIGIFRLRVHLKRFLNKFLVLLVGLVFLLAGNSEADGLPVQWSVSNFSLAKKALVLEPSSRTIEMKAGWACTVKASAELAGGGESRVTVCSRGGESFEFSVECGAHRMRDYAQVRLRNRRGEYVDHIEVSCKYAL